MNTEKIMEDIQSIQDNIREIKSTWGNTIMTLDNIKSGLKADVQKKVDEAYRRGLEDGKWKAEDGCDGCKYYEDTSLTNPCSECSRGHVDHYKPVSDPDRIEVGDEVEAAFGTAVVVCCDYDADKASYIYSSGRHGFDNTWNLKKTGKHYDIQSILEAMRE